MSPSETANSTDRNSHDWVDPMLIEHVVRFWEAERENAARIASKQQLISAGIIGLLGLGLYKIDWYADPDALLRATNPIAIWIVKSCLIGSTGLFAWSLWILWGGSAKEERGSTASRWLRLTDSDMKRTSSRVVLSRTHRAAAELQERNRLHWERLRDSQMWFVIGIGLILLSIVLYVAFAVPPIAT